MPKTYVSGFLYNLKTHQILLLQSEPKEDTSSSWSMLGGEAKEGEDAQGAFQRIIKDFLSFDLKTKDIFPIYDYVHEASGRTNYVLYAEVKSPPVFKDINASWVSFAETLKFLFSDHTKQDVVVGARVIDLKWRISRNIQ